MLTMFCASQISVSVNGCVLLDCAMCELRDIWEETSFVLERRQTNPHCAHEEQTGMKKRQIPPYTLTFDTDAQVTIPVPLGNFFVRFNVRCILMILMWVGKQSEDT